MPGTALGWCRITGKGSGTGPRQGNGSGKGTVGCSAGFRRPAPAPPSRRLRAADSLDARLRRSRIAAVAQALSNLTVRRTLRITRATCTGLIGTGDMRLIASVGLRDRIIGLYEESDRYATIVDRNNQVFVDQVSAIYVLDNAIVAIRGRHNRSDVGTSDREFTAKIGPTSARPRDRVWQIEPVVRLGRRPGWQGAASEPLAPGVMPRRTKSRASRISRYTQANRPENQETA